MSPQQQYLRQSIKEWFCLLQRELGHYEQTTHGSLVAQGCGIEEVAEMLVQVYNSPGAHSISELAQRIDGFVEESRK